MIKSLKKSFAFSLLILIYSCQQEKKEIPAIVVLPNEQTKSSSMLFPTKSQFGISMQIIGNSAVKIQYYRPNVNSRLIWGNVVKWDTIWRTGAEKATLIHFEDDVFVDGNPVPKGDYSFFT